MKTVILVTVAATSLPFIKLDVLVPVDTPNKKAVGIITNNGYLLVPNNQRLKVAPGKLMYKSRLVPDVTMWKVKKVKNGLVRRRDFYTDNLFIKGKEVETHLWYTPWQTVFMTTVAQDLLPGTPAYDKDGKVVAVLYGHGVLALWCPLADHTQIEKAWRKWSFEQKQLELKKGGV